MQSIYGNNFLISIAFTATSPTQAAKTAQLMGYSREQVRAVRNAAALKRDHNEAEFRQTFEPFEIIPINAEPCVRMTMELFVDKTYEQRPLNTTEWNEIASWIRTELKKLNIEAKIQPKSSNPFARSNIFSKTK